MAYSKQRTQSGFDSCAEAAIAILATSRATKLIVDDAIFDKARELVWKRFPPHEHGPGFVLTCPACASVWAALIVVTRVLPRPLRYTLALSEAVLILRKILRED